MKPLASHTVGIRLKQARDKRQLTMAALGNKADVGASTINSIEKGKKVPRGDTVELLAIALEVDPAWLLFGSGPKPNWGD
jgi:transcriptional regulator with XRE-family HTH domain